jgi:tight adherence protein C
MSNQEISLLASIIALIFSLHLGAKAYVKRRDEGLAEQEEEELDPFDLSLKGSGGPQSPRLGAFSQLLRSDDVEVISKIRQLLNYAGKRRPEDLELYYMWRGTVIVISLLLGAVMLFFEVRVIFPMLLVAVGYLGPERLLKAQGEARQTEIRRSLPHTLDLLITCMEAGLNLEQAIDRVTREIRASDPALADEFTVVLQELNAGLSVGASIKKLSQRVSSEELRNLCNVIVQSVTLGSSLGRAMREYAAAGRRKRELRLEEDAGNVTAKLTLPLTICLLPSAILAMLAPAVVTIIESMM